MKVLLVSLLPDIGHVIPLLRIGRTLSASGATVGYIGPAETMPVAQHAAVQAQSIGAVRPTSGANFLAMAARVSPLLNELVVDKLAYQEYFLPLTVQGLGRLEAATEMARLHRPDVVISDEHIFGACYRHIAASVSAPLVMHRPYGSYYLPRRLSGAVGADLKRTLRGICGAATARWVRHFDPARSRRWKNQRAEYVRLSALIEKSRSGPAPRVHRITTGTAPIEKELLGEAPAELADVVTFGPLAPLDGGGPAPGVQWLDALPAGSVLYVSFGTMATAVPRLLEAVVSAALENELGILWASAERPSSRGIEQLGERFHWVSWTSPSKVLAHPAVAAFVSHAGSGAIQDSVWAVKPLICIPLLWDQHYNARLVERLGAGVRLEKGSMSRATVGAALKTVLHPAMSGSLQRLASRFRELDGDRCLTEWMTAQMP